MSRQKLRNITSYLPLLLPLAMCALVVNPSLSSALPSLYRPLPSRPPAERSFNDQQGGILLRQPIRLLPRVLARRYFAAGGYVLRRGAEVYAYPYYRQLRTKVISGYVYTREEDASTRSGAIGHFFITHTTLQQSKRGSKRPRGWYAFLDIPSNPQTIETNYSGRSNLLIRTDPATRFCGTNYEMPLDPELQQDYQSQPNSHSQQNGGNSESLPDSTSPITHFADSHPKSNRLIEAVDEASPSLAVIDLLVLYSPDAARSAGGQSAIVSEISAAIGAANRGLVNSRVEGVSYRVVGAELLNYVDDTGVAERWLREFDNPSSLVAAEVRNRRDAAAADITIMVFHTSDPYCGLTNQLWGAHTAATGGCYQFPRPPRSSCPRANDRAFVAVSRRCFAAHSLFHELAHQGGAHHHFDEVPTVGGIRLCGLLPDSCAHLFLGASGNPYRTVMATNAVQGTRINLLSNPLLAFEGTRTGIPNQRNNAQAVATTASFLASFRPSPTPLQPEVNEDRPEPQIPTPSPLPPPPSSTLSPIESPAPNPTVPGLGPLPNLTIDKLSYRKPLRGRIVLKAIVVNNGAAATTPFALTLRAAGSKLATSRSRAINPGEKRAIRLRLDNPPKANTRLTVIVDANRRITEENERDNRKTIRIR